MELLYFSGAHNFGDELNAWLWPRIFPDLNAYGGSKDLFVGIGTILDRRIPDAPCKVIFGTGVRFPHDLPAIDGRWDIRFVRGPLSARVLQSRSITDPALCLRMLDIPAPPKSAAIGFMPHFLTEAEGGPWPIACKIAGLKYISPTAPVEDTIHEIRGCEALVTEAMHGAIVADMYRVPWTHVKIWADQREGDGVSDFKWNDWCGSVQIEHRFDRVPMLWSAGIKPFVKLPFVIKALRRVVRNVVLSADSALDNRLSDLRQAVQAFKLEYDERQRGSGKKSDGGKQASRLLKNRQFKRAGAA